MSRENDFQDDTKTRLAERAGYKCCYLGCGQATVGPSKENNDTGKSNTGVAAHIYSASFGKGARRVPPEGMTSEEIKSINNGIWMCQTHGTYIDKDEITFTPQELKKWKEIGEEVARRMQSFRRTYLEVLSELEHSNSKISEMISYAQKHDPSKDRYDTLDLLLYRKILQMLPESVRLNARQGAFIHLHSDVSRDTINRYLYKTENYPVDFSFYDKKIQKSKEEMDQSLENLTGKLSMTTFPHIINGKMHYRMSPDWKKTEEGLSLYIKTENEIVQLSTEFIELFDRFHKLCRDKYLE